MTFFSNVSRHQNFTSQWTALQWLNPDLQQQAHGSWAQPQLQTVTAGAPGVFRVGLGLYLLVSGPKYSELVEAATESPPMTRTPSIWEQDALGPNASSASSAN
jgi:hypothetical protein